MTLNEIDGSPESLGEQFDTARGYNADNLDAEATRLQGIIDALIAKRCGDDEVLREAYVLSREIDVAEILGAFGRQPTIAEWDRSGFIGLQDIADGLRKCDGCDQWEPDVEQCRIRFNEHAGDKAGTWETAEYCGGCIVATEFAIECGDPDTVDRIERSEGIAIAFARRLLASLGGSTVAEIVRRNDAEADVHVCHSHDFCDANEEMAEAFRSVTGREPQIDSDEDAALWSDAWSLAVRRRLRVSRH